MGKTFLAEPTWVRLGFPCPPDDNISGKGVGIVIIDNVINHPEVRHLRGRLKKITVNNDFSITYKDVVSEEPEAQAPYISGAEHGMMSLFLLSHLPFEIDNKKYVGLVPAANFFMLTNNEPEQIRRGLDWIIERREEWNIQVVLSMFTPQGGGNIRSPKEEPYVQALMPAVEAGLLVVSANGNSSAVNNYQPIEFLAVGGYEDEGISDLSMRKPHLSSSWGINGDGHMRPDILAPFSYLPAPYYESKGPELYSKFYDASKSNIKLSYFAGTSGASTLIAGLCVHLLSKYHSLTIDILRKALIHYGVSIRNASNPAPSIHVGQIVEAISKDYTFFQSPTYIEAQDIKHFANDYYLVREMERGKSLTKLIEQGKCTRKMLWQYANDEAARVKKVAIWALKKPMDLEEKRKAWEYFHKSKDDGTGVRESWAYMLLNGSIREELDKWMNLINEKSTDIRLCVKIFLRNHYSDAPELEHSPSTNPNTLSEIIQPVLKWYRGYKNVNSKT